MELPAGAVSPVEGALVPVLVDAVGRSGTTALMQLLASSPAVVCERNYPFESRYLTYLYSWSRLLDGDPKAAGKWNRDAMLAEDPTQFGGLPWRELLPDPSEFAADCLQDAWRRFSKAAGSDCSHYIEKVSRRLSGEISKLMPAARVIYLIRDPRDVWLSIEAFNRKRGFLGLGRKAEEDEEGFFARFVESCRPLLEPLVGREFGECERMLRYEDMVTEPGWTATELGTWLGLSLDAASLSVKKDEHLTSSSPAASVGRWRKEMPRALKKRFDRDLGGLLEQLGY